MVSCQRVVGNRVVAATSAYAREQLRARPRFGGAPPQSRSFPPMLVEMIGVGEETGALDKCSVKLPPSTSRKWSGPSRSSARFWSRSLWCCWPVVVAIVLTSVFLPMFQIIEVIQ